MDSSIGGFASSIDKDSLYEMNSNISDDIWIYMFIVLELMYQLVHYLRRLTASSSSAASTLVVVSFFSDLLDWSYISLSLVAEI